MRILNGDVLTSHGDLRARSALLQIMEAALQAGDPYQATLKLLRVERGRLIVGNPDFEPSGSPWTGEEVFDLSKVGRIFVLGAAKGVQYVAKAIEEVLGDRLTGGYVIAKHGDDHLLEKIAVTYGAHPVPDEGCVEGCRRILRICQDLREEDLVFTIVGNGVSSLLTLPSPGLSLEDIRRTTYVMQIEGGVPTQDLNPVRNHLDMLKGGKISRYIQPATAIHIVAYDPDGVVREDVRGYESLVHRNRFMHTLPDFTSFADAVNMLKKWDAWEAVSPSVREHLLRADPAEETVRAEEFERWRCRIFGVMPRELGILPTAARKAAELGFRPHILSTWLQAEASQAAFTIMDIARSIEKEGHPFAPPCALLTSGELLVTVGKEKGVGGRNQEYVLAAALKIAGSRNILAGAVDTDGTDGPGTQFVSGDFCCLAGGIADGSTVARATEAEIDLFDAVRRHDTSQALWKLEDGVLATHNISVNDLGVTLILGRS